MKYILNIFIIFKVKYRFSSMVLVRVSRQLFDRSLKATLAWCILFIVYLFNSFKNKFKKWLWFLDALLGLFYCVVFLTIHNGYKVQYFQNLQSLQIHTSGRDTSWWNYQKKWPDKISGQKIMIFQCDFQHCRWVQTSRKSHWQKSLRKMWLSPTSP